MARRGPAGSDLPSMSTKKTWPSIRTATRGRAGSVGLRGRGGRPSSAMSGEHSEGAEAEQDERGGLGDDRGIEELPDPIIVVGQRRQVAELAPQPLALHEDIDAGRIEAG